MSGLVISLTLCLLQPAHHAVDGIEPRQCYELRTYDSRVECDITAKAIRVKATGARIRCVPRELSADEKRAIAIAEGSWPWPTARPGRAADGAARGYPGDDRPADDATASSQGALR